MKPKFGNLMETFIEEEIVEIERSGQKVRLKTLSSRRWKKSIIFGAVFALLLLVDAWVFAFITMVVYFVQLYKLNNASIITELAKKSPDTDFEDIIRGDMK